MRFPGPAFSDIPSLDAGLAFMCACTKGSSAISVAVVGFYALAEFLHHSTV